MTARITVEPTVEPVTLAEAKLHCRVDNDDEDAYIQGLIRTARIYCEKFTGRSFVERTVEYTLDDWPPRRAITLPREPIKSISTVKYTAKDGTIYTMVAGVDYLTDTVNGRIILPPDISWPTDTLYPVNPIAITYIAGYTRSRDEEIIAEAVGTGDATEDTFTLADPPVKAGSLTVYLGGVITTAYTFTAATGVIVFTTEPGIGVAITADYTTEPDYRANIPETFKAAIKLCVGTWYENREGVLPAGHVGKQLPTGVDSLLQMDRTFWLEEMNR